ncbi:MAG: hypothetical protein CMN97_05450 [Synechococcus sp. NAT40]|nr:hypothetical protein [Synechococcus sp. NAT40]
MRWRFDELIRAWSGRSLFEGLLEDLLLSCGQDPSGGVCAGLVHRGFTSTACALHLCSSAGPPDECSL